MDETLRTFVAMLQSPAYMEREHDTTWDAYMDAMGALRAASGDNLAVFTAVGQSIGACMGPMPDTVSVRAAT